nr:response regulator [Paenibacillus elgii]
MHVVVVEDEPMIRLGLARMVERYGAGRLRVTALANGEEAAAFVRETPPDLVLTDIRMPRMDGLELCRIISETRPSVKAVVISGYGEFAYVQKCLTYGVKEYLLKPVTPGELYSVLDRVLKPAQADDAPSISEYEQWLDSLEEAIWSADPGAAVACWTEGKDRYFEAHASPERMSAAVNDVLRLLVKRLNARDIFLFPEPHERRSFPGRLEALAFLEEEIFKLSGLLQTYRGGNLKNVWEEAKAYIDDIWRRISAWRRSPGKWASRRLTSVTCSKNRRTRRSCNTASANGWKWPSGCWKFLITRSSTSPWPSVTRAIRTSPSCSKRRSAVPLPSIANRSA